MTMDVNVQEDLNAVNDQLAKLVEELNKINSSREQLITQVQNLKGGSLYLRGKVPPEEQDEAIGTSMESEDESLDRSSEYPVTNT